MVRSALFEAVATLFVAARLALQGSSEAVVLNTGARRRYGVYGRNEALEAFLRANAALRLDCLETPDVIRLPWKEDANHGLRDVKLLEPARCPQRLRTPQKSPRSPQCTRSFSPRTVNALRSELEQAQENAVALNEQLVQFRNKVQEQRRSRALARAEGAETSQRIENMVQRCEELLAKNSSALPASPLTTSPRSSVLSPKTPTSPSKLHSAKDPITSDNSSVSDSDLHEQIRRLQAENNRFRHQLQSSPRQQFLSPSSLSDVTASPPDRKSGVQFSVQHDIDEIKLHAFKEVLQARSRARVLEAEIEEHRLHKAQVRDWVCRFVQQMQTEKSTLVQHVHKAQTTNAELRAKIARQSADIDALRCELVETSRARAKAEAQLGAVRAHHEALASELSARNAELACVQQEMVEARDTYTRATSIASDEMQSFDALVRSERNLVRRNLSLRSEVTELKRQAESVEGLMAERDELQRSLANMANLVNTAQSKLISVERELVAERARKSGAAVESITLPSPPISPKITSLRRQLGAVLRSPTTPKKKKRSDRETQLQDIKNKI